VAVNVIMKRTPKSGVMGKLTAVLQELRQLATSQPGYISGETLYSAFNPGSTIVVSKWMSLQHWQEYENCQMVVAVSCRIAVDGCRVTLECADAGGG